MKATYSPADNNVPFTCVRCRLRADDPDVDRVDCEHEWVGGPKLTLGLGDDDADVLVITADAVNVPAKFKGACRKHPDVTTTGK